MEAAFPTLDLAWVRKWPTGSWPVRYSAARASGNQYSKTHKNAAPLVAACPRCAVSPICNRLGFRQRAAQGQWNGWQTASLRYSAARASRNQKPNRKIIKEFQGFLPTEKSSRNETIPSDTDRSEICATARPAQNPPPAKVTGRRGDASERCSSRRYRPLNRTASRRVSRIIAFDLRNWIKQGATPIV